MLRNWLITIIVLIIIIFLGVLSYKAGYIGPGPGTTTLVTAPYGNSTLTTIEGGNSTTTVPTSNSSSTTTVVSTTTVSTTTVSGGGSGTSVSTISTISTVVSTILTTVSSGGAGPQYIYCIGATFNGLSNATYYATINSSGIGAWHLSQLYPIQFGYTDCPIYGGYIYCVGGPVVSENQTYYAPISASGGIGAWTQSSSYPLPYRLNYAGCSVYNGYIYCVGGYNGDPISQIPINTVYYASISSSGIGGWMLTTPYPTNNFTNAGCSIYNGYIYCVGNDAYGAASVANRSYFAPILANGGIGGWNRTTGYPNLLHLGSCSITNGYIYCLGSGTTFSNKTYYAKVTRYGIGGWNATTPYPLHSFSNAPCVTYGNYLFCMGGGYRGSQYNFTYFAPLSSSGIGAWQSTTPTPMKSGLVSSCAVPGGNSGFHWSSSQVNYTLTSVSSTISSTTLSTTTGETTSIGETTYTTTVFPCGHSFGCVSSQPPASDCPANCPVTKTPIQGCVSGLLDYYCAGSGSTTTVTSTTLSTTTISTITTLSTSTVTTTILYDTNSTNNTQSFISVSTSGLDKRVFCVGSNVAGISSVSWNVYKSTSDTSNGNATNSNACGMGGPTGGQVVGALGTRTLDPIYLVNSTACNSYPCSTMGDGWVVPQTGAYVFVMFSAWWPSSSLSYSIGVPSYCTKQFATPIGQNSNGAEGVVAIYACSFSTQNGAASMSLPSGLVNGGKIAISAIVVT